MQQQGNRKILYLVILSVSMAFLSAGVASGWPTVALDKFKNNQTKVDINKNETGVMLSMSPLGFTAGSLVTRFLADRFGRRTTILGSALPVAIGSVIAAFALKAWLLYITAFTWNCGTGMMSTVIGLYTAEIADKDVRGRLAIITSFMFKLGLLLTMSIGPLMSYEAFNYTLLILPLLYLVLCWWIPETPYYCLKQGDVDGARKSLRLLRGYQDDQLLEEELLAIKSDVNKEMVHSSSFCELITGRQYRKAIIIACGLKVTLMLTGGVIIRHYLTWIIDDTKLSDVITMSYVLLIYGAIGFVTSLMSSILVDKVSRRALLFGSYIGTSVSLFAVGIYFFVQDVVRLDVSTLTKISFLPLLGIIMANVISTMGFNSLIFVIPAEIFPMNVKAVAMTSLNILGSLIAFTLAIMYQKIKDNFGSYVVFWIFSGFGFAGALFSYFVVTETGGKQLRDIQMELQGKGYDALAKNEPTRDQEGTELEEIKKDKMEVIKC